MLSNFLRMLAAAVITAAVTLGLFFGASALVGGAQSDLEEQISQQTQEILTTLKEGGSHNTQEILDLLKKSGIATGDDHDVFICLLTTIPENHGIWTHAQVKECLGEGS